MQAVVEALALHGVDTDALVVLEHASHAVVQTAVHAPLAVERVGFALGAWQQRREELMTSLATRGSFTTATRTTESKKMGLTTSQQVLDQLLMAAEACVIPFWWRGK